MIDAIRDYMDNGVQMNYVSKAGPRQLFFKGGSVTDPMGEFDNYSIEQSYDGRTLIRFYLGGVPAGYLMHKRHGTWQGHNRSVWTELTPVDPNPWLNLRNYVPPKKEITQPIVENVKNLKEFESYESKYTHEPGGPEAVVVLVTSANTKVVELIQSNVLTTEANRDIIIEVDGLPITGLQDLQNKISEAAASSPSNIHLVFHKTHFGLGRLVINAHNNAFSMYERVMFIEDPIKMTGDAVDLCFRLHEYNKLNYKVSASSVYSSVAEDGPKYKSIEGELQNAYVMDSEVWQAIQESMNEYKKLFLITDYATRPHHSILKWIHDKFQLRIDSSEVHYVMDYVARVKLMSRVFRLSAARAVKVGEPISSAQDPSRKMFN